MKLWQRVLIVVVGAATAYALWRLPPSGVSGVLVALGAGWLGRSIYRSKLAANPMGENRDYSLRPVATAVAKSISSFAAAMVWIAFTANAVGRGYIPDTWLGVGVVLGPGLALLLISVMYFAKAIARFRLGGKPPSG